MEKECKDRLNEIASKFKICCKALIAIGDETRQLIFMTVLESDFKGVKHIGENDKRL